MHLYLPSRELGNAGTRTSMSSVISPAGPSGHTRGTVRLLMALAFREGRGTSARPMRVCLQGQAGKGWGGAGGHCMGKRRRDGRTTQASHALLRSSVLDLNAQHRLGCGGVVDGRSVFKGDDDVPPCWWGGGGAGDTQPPTLASAHNAPHLSNPSPPPPSATHPVAPAWLPVFTDTVVSTVRSKR